MNTLKLYDPPEVAPLSVVEPAELSLSCTRCALHSGVKHVCVGPLLSRSEPGGVLVVGDRPGLEEDRAGRLNRHRLQSWVDAAGYTGPIYYDVAVRCHHTESEPGDEVVGACRPYLAQVVADLKPSRILAMGHAASRSIMGRPLPTATRRGYAYLGDVPIFLMHEAVRAATNMFVEKSFREDLHWALVEPAPRPPPWDASIFQVSTEEDALQSEREMRTADIFSFDVETYGRQHDKDFELLSVAFCARGKTDGWVVLIEDLRKPEVGRIIDRLMADPRVKKTGQNTKYDTVTWRLTRGDIRGVTGDTRLMGKLLDVEADGHLAQMANLVGMGGHKDENTRVKEQIKEDVRQAIAARKKRKETPQGRFGFTGPADAILNRLNGKPLDEGVINAFTPKPVLMRYNARDSVSTMLLHEHFERLLAGEPDLERTWQQLVSPAVRAAEWMEFWGIAASRQAVSSFQAHLETGIAKVVARLEQEAGAGFNPRSNQQVAALLFEKLQLPPQGETESGAPSTDEETLTALKAFHPMAGYLLEFRKLDAALKFAAGKDGDAGLLDHIRGDGRVHTSIHLDGARTGRLSSSDPNVQNIISPKRDKVLGTMARNCFVAPPGSVLLSFDYKQVELRIMAMLADDDVMAEVFKSGVDYHLRTAQLVSQLAWGIPPEAVKDEHRSAAKTVNFGLAYGQSDYTLASNLGCSVEKAEEIRGAILGRFKKLDRWIKQRIAETSSTGYAWTWWNGHRARRRSLFAIAERSDHEAMRAAKSKATNGSFNGPVQGTANEFCLASAVAVVERIVDEGLPAKLCFPIHDALLLEVKERDVAEVVGEVVSIMTGFNSGSIPLEVDIERGPAWGVLEKMKA